MHDYVTNAKSSTLEMRWIPATDERGRTRMEMVWVVPTTTASATHAA